MIAPMPSNVRSSAVSVRFSAFPPPSTSPTSCSIDFVLNKFESIHPPVTRPGSSGRHYSTNFRNLTVLQGCSRFCLVLPGSGESRDEVAGAGFRIAVEQIADDRNPQRTGTDDVQCVVQRQAANGDERRAAASRAA